MNKYTIFKCWREGYRLPKIKEVTGYSDHQIQIAFREVVEDWFNGKTTSWTIKEAFESPLFPTLDLEFTTSSRFISGGVIL